MIALEPINGGTLDRQRHRAIRWAYLRTWRDLRLSVARGRPISLANLVRLHKRRLWNLDIDPGSFALARWSPAALARRYRQSRPAARSAANC